MNQLSPDDLYTLTGWKRSSDQSRWLTERGIPHRVDGRRVIALAEHVTKWVEGRPMAMHAEPNWGAVR